MVQEKHPMNRRQFLSAAAAATAAAVGKSTPMLPIVDTHQHLWDLTKFRLPWLKEGDVFNKSHVMSDYLKATAGLNVVKTIYMEVDVAPEQQNEEAEYVIGLCKRADKPMVAAVISGRPASDGFAKYIRPVQGQRRTSKASARCCTRTVRRRATVSTRSSSRASGLLGELGMSFDLCMRGKELLDAAKLIDACPDTRFILDHCGNADVQAKDPIAVAKRTSRKWPSGKTWSARCPASSRHAEPGKWTADDLAPIVNHTMEVFGPDRVMFGGDWPVCTKAATYKQWVEALKSIVADRKEEERRKLFADNAVRVYGLSEG